MSGAGGVVARTVAAVPLRSATDAWAVIVGLLAPDTRSAARRELDAVAGVACTLIADEALAADPAVVYGAGPRVRVYAAYGDDAITGDGVREDAFSFVPTDGAWQMSLPCLPDDLAWVQRRLADLSTRVRARAVGEPVPGEAEDDAGRSAAVGKQASAGVPTVNLDAFLRP